MEKQRGELSLSKTSDQDSLDRSIVFTKSLILTVAYRENKVVSLGKTTANVRTALIVNGY